MLRIIGSLIFIIIFDVIGFLINPIIGILWTVLPIVAVIYNWKRL